MGTALEETIKNEEPSDAAASGTSSNVGRRFKSKGKFRLIAVTGALLLAAGSATLYSYYDRRETTDDAEVDAHVAPIAAKVSGNIIQVLADDNQHVKAGQVLVRIDPRDYQVRVDQARAAVSNAENRAESASINVPLTDQTTSIGTQGAAAELAAAEAGYTKAKTDYERYSTSEVAYAKANVEATRATYDRALADLERMKPLVQKDEISKQQYDSYLAGERVAESSWRAAQDQFANAEKMALSSQAAMLTAHAQIEAADAKLEQSRADRQQVRIQSAHASSARAAVQQAHANLEAAELQLSYTTVVAPIDGVVSGKSIQVGQIVKAGQPMLTIVPLQHVWVTANFKETQLAHVRPGQTAEVSVDMYGKTFPAHVDSIAGASGAQLSLLPPENATGNFVKVVQRVPVKLVVDNAPTQFTLRPGMNVVATILTK